MYIRAKKLPPFNIVNKYIAYNIITGVFTWKVRKSNKVAGSIAGRIKDKSGYRYITIDRQECAAHRIAWLLVTKKDPWPYEIDHKDGNASNNAFHNLRPATPKENSGNRKIGKNNTSGYKSIKHKSHQKNPWVVNIQQQNKNHYVGSFPTKEMAIEARDKKGKEIYGKFYRP